MTVFPRSVAGHSAEDMTPKEGRVLEFILGFYDSHGRFPSLRQIRVEFAYRSVGAARYHVDKLEKKGWLGIKRTRFLESGGRVTHSSRIESALIPNTPSRVGSGYGADPYRGPVPLHSGASD